MTVTSKHNKSTVNRKESATYQVHPPKWEHYKTSGWDQWPTSPTYRDWQWTAGHKSELALISGLYLSNERLAVWPWHFPLSILKELALCSLLLGWALHCCQWLLPAWWATKNKRWKRESSEISKTASIRGIKAGWGFALLRAGQDRLLGILFCDRRRKKS